MRYHELNADLSKASKRFLQEHNSFFHAHFSLFTSLGRIDFRGAILDPFQCLIGPLRTQERDVYNALYWDQF